MNIISFENAYCLYPRGTLLERRSLICATAGPRQERARQKYITRGWDMVQALDCNERHDPKSAFAQRSRWIGDGFCWTIPLPLKGVAVPPHPRLSPTHDNLKTNGWLLQTTGDACGSGKAMGITFHILCSPVLQQSYTVVDEDLLQWLYPQLLRAEDSKRKRCVGPHSRFCASCQNSF